VSEATWDARYTESTMYLWYRDRDTVYATTIFFSPNKITMPLTKAVEYCSRTYQARAKNASVLLVLFRESVLFLSFVRFSYQLVQLSAYLYIE